MVYKTAKIPSDFGLSKVRDSFMRHFIDQENDGDRDAANKESEQEEMKAIEHSSSSKLISAPKQTRLRGQGHRKSDISTIIRYP